MTRPGLILLLLVLAACGRPVPAPGPGAEMSSARQIAPISVTAPNFSDADPHDWQGRSPAAYPVHGIDLSRWQVDVDWQTARANGVNFAFIKATEGGDRLDPRYEGHRQAATAAGVVHGAYHFYYWCTSPEVQARWFIANVPREAGHLPPVLDVEWNPHSPTCTRRPPPEEVRAQMRVFLDMLARHYGQRPVIYTTRDFWEQNALAQMTGEEFWLRSTAGHPSETYGGARWSFWQYSGTGLVPGIGGRVDLNAFAGSEAAWVEWLNRRRQ